MRLLKIHLRSDLARGNGERSAAALRKEPYLVDAFILEEL